MVIFTVTILLPGPARWVCKMRRMQDLLAKRREPQMQAAAIHARLLRRGQRQREEMHLRFPATWWGPPEELLLLPAVPSLEVQPLGPHEEVPPESAWKRRTLGPEQEDVRILPGHFRKFFARPPRHGQASATLPPDQGHQRNPKVVFFCQNQIEDTVRHFGSGQKAEAGLLEWWRRRPFNKEPWRTIFQKEETEWRSQACFNSQVGYSESSGQIWAKGYASVKVGCYESCVKVGCYESCGQTWSASKGEGRSVRSKDHSCQTWAEGWSVRTEEVHSCKTWPEGCSLQVGWVVYSVQETGPFASEFKADQDHIHSYESIWSTKRSSSWWRWGMYYFRSDSSVKSFKLRIYLFLGG